ncbi:MAG: signal recognition particle-docking protein FtsY, partial [Defluviitaleaceae bacterium]|nr:signal recognition particle-docking protein FtsY [Defluviitaleaceae bacterium]
IVETLRERVKTEKIIDIEQFSLAVQEEIEKILLAEVDDFVVTSPTVILIVGVNGVGKTTTIGKLAYFYKREGKKVLLAAGDTFRAAAIDQLEVWAERSEVDIIKHKENSDPAAVIFDASRALKARGADILIADTAGRLHNKKNLMEELKKIKRTIEKELPEAAIETLLVLDANTGQNALVQAKSFLESVNITGLVLTKLDSTAKGGVVVSIKDELNIPIRFACIGEGIEDIYLFDSKAYVEAIFDKPSLENTIENEEQLLEV